MQVWCSVLCWQFGEWRVNALTAFSQVSNHDHSTSERFKDNLLLTTQKSLVIFPLTQVPRQSHILKIKENVYSFITEQILIFKRQNVFQWSLVNPDPGKPDSPINSGSNVAQYWSLKLLLLKSIILLILSSSYTLRHTIFALRSFTLALSYNLLYVVSTTEFHLSGPDSWVKRTTLSPCSPDDRGSTTLIPYKISLFQWT